jgi:hypothetical protein
VSDPILDVEVSAECAALLEALSAFQGDVTPPKKSSANPHFKSKFADLAEVLEAVRAPMAKHGLSLLQMPVGSCDGVVRLVTIVGHKSGQWLKGKLDMPLSQKTPQGVGSTISYARRYCAMAALGIAAEDDDGESAEGRGRGQGAAKAGPSSPATTQQRDTGTAPASASADVPLVVATLVDEAAKLQEFGQLADFYVYARERLSNASATEQQRARVLDAWGTRCKALNFSPRDVANVAQKKTVEAAHD